MSRPQGITRSRWAALGAAVAVTIGSGGLLPASASIGSGERPVIVSITPCRLLDTRTAPDTVGPRSAPLAEGDTHTVPVRGTNGNCTIPSDAGGLVLNVAVIGPTAPSYLVVYPADATRPLAANLNWLAGDPPLSNAVTVDVSADGRISFYNLAGSVNIAVDVVAYLVDHNHDDAYYTKAQADAQYYTQTDADARYYTQAQADARYYTKTDADARYYTKAQVDALLAAAKDDVWGYVISNGGIHAGSGNFTVTNPAVGQYCIVVSRRSSYKAAQATLADPGGTNIVSVGTGHGSACNPLNTATHDAIPVYVKTPANVAVNGNFTFVVPAP